MRRFGLQDVFLRIRPAPSSLQFRLNDSELRRAVAVGETLCRRARLPSTCLYRALSRWVLLCWQARDATFVMAIDPDLRGEEAHAWVEESAQIFLEQARPSLIVVYRHPNDA